MTTITAGFKEFHWSNFQHPEKLGEGGQGKVYKTYDKRRQTTVVVKDIDTTKVMDSDILAEITALNAVESICQKNILCKLDFAQKGSHFYIVTEYLGEYMTLEQLRYAPDQRLFLIAKNLVEGLMDLHRIGIAHRDLKPENLMVQRTGTNIKYIDFGLSCYKERCNNGRRVGSPYYYAPEMYVLENRDPDFPSDMNRWFMVDIWSLGVVLLEMCCHMFDETISLSEFLGQEYGIDLYVENDTDFYNNLFQLYRILHNNGLTNEMLSRVYRQFPVSDPMKQFITRCIQPMLHRTPKHRKLICPEPI